MRVEEILRYMLGSFAGTVGIAWLCRSPRKSWLPSGIIAMLVYMLYWLLPMTGLSIYSAVFCGSLFGSVAGHFCARRMKMINTVFLMSAIVPVVPGLGLYRMMASLGQGRMTQGVNEGLQAMIIIIMTALGLIMGGFLSRVTYRKQERRK